MPKVVYIQDVLIDALEKRAAKELVKVGTYVNNLLRQELTGQRAPVVADEEEEEEEEACTFCIGHPRRVKPEEGCKVKRHEDRWLVLGKQGLCDVCHACDGRY